MTEAEPALAPDTIDQLFQETIAQRRAKEPAKKASKKAKQAEASNTTNSAPSPIAEEVKLMQDKVKYETLKSMLPGSATGLAGVPGPVGAFQPPPPPVTKADGSIDVQATAY